MSDGHQPFCWCRRRESNPARASGDRRVETVALEEIQPLTGYVRCGVMALAGKKDSPVFIEIALLFEQMAVSAGVRWTQILPNHTHFRIPFRVFPDSVSCVEYVGP